jgi:hypothetical protein
LPRRETTPISFQRKPIDGLGVRLERPQVTVHHALPASI